MSFEITSCFAGELTLHASERPLSRVCPHVCLEATICCAFVFTLFTAERLFSGMNKNVLFQITIIGGQEGAHWASVRFFILIWLQQFQHVIEEVSNTKMLCPKGAPSGWHLRTHLKSHANATPM